MAPLFVINGLRVSKDFIADLTSKEYAEKFRQRRIKKTKKLMKKLDKKRKIKVKTNGMVAKEETPKKKVAPLVTVNK